MKIIKERIMGGRLKLLRKWSGGGVIASTEGLVCVFSF